MASWCIIYIEIYFFPRTLNVHAHPYSTEFFFISAYSQPIAFKNLTSMTSSANDFLCGLLMRDSFPAPKTVCRYPTLKLCAYP